jgi:ubiquinone biosynthesis protein UbiJ
MSNSNDIRAGGAFVELSADAKSMQAGMNAAQQHLTGFSAEASKKLLKLGKAFAGVFAFKNLAGFVSTSVSLANVQEDAERKLAHAIAQTGRAAGRTLTEMKAFASARQEVTKFGDEATLAAMRTLTAFTSIKGDIFDDAIVAAQDLAEATDTDLSSAAATLGRALEDPARGMLLLRRNGIILTAEQEKLIKGFIETGNKAAAQGVILDAVNSKYGGTAQAMANTYSGKVKQLTDAFSDLREEIGEAIKPVISEMIPALQSLVKWLQGGAGGVNVLKVAIADLRGWLLDTTATFMEFIASIAKSISQFSRFIGVDIGVDGSLMAAWAETTREEAADIRASARDFGEDVGEDFGDGLADGMGAGMEELARKLAALRDAFGDQIGEGFNTITAGSGAGTFSARGAGQLGMSVDKQQLDVMRKIQDILTKQNELIGDLELGGLVA